MQRQRWRIQCIIVYKSTCVVQHVWECQQKTTSYNFCKSRILRLSCCISWFELCWCTKIEKGEWVALFEIILPVTTSTSNNVHTIFIHPCMTQTRSTISGLHPTSPLTLKLPLRYPSHDPTVGLDYHKSGNNYNCTMSLLTGQYESILDVKGCKMHWTGK